LARRPRLPLAFQPVDVAGGAPPTGFWESVPLTERGESASVLVRRMAGRTFVTNISTPSPNCRGQFGIFGEPGARLPRLRVDGRGRFRAARRGQTDGIAAVDGRFIGRRPRLAMLRARWRSGPCRSSARFRLRPVRRVPVRDGAWTGTQADGGTISFEVVNTGREATDFAFAWSPEFRCADGSTHRYPSYRGGTELAWIRRDGSFSLTRPMTTCCSPCRAASAGAPGADRSASSRRTLTLAVSATPAPSTSARAASGRPVASVWLYRRAGAAVRGSSFSGTAIAS
jgi:hypothetical protein